jgi:hypothetical protein
MRQTMPSKSEGRLKYGPRKYAGLHLMLCRWLRLHGDSSKQYCYVTLGGTEMKDIQALRFADLNLTSSVWSYETNQKRYGLAKQAASDLATYGVNVDLQCATFFSHTRKSQLPHIFFVDLPGICAWGDYDLRFAELFQNEVIREGDCLLITSHLGHNRGLKEIRKYFAGEFAVLGVDEDDDGRVRSVYRRAHPTMTLFKALSLNGIQSELHLHCFGMVKYRDVDHTPMGIYGYTVSAGTTELRTLVWDSSTNYFDVNEGRLCSGDSF